MRRATATLTSVLSAALGTLGAVLGRGRRGVAPRSKRRDRAGRRHREGGGRIRNRRTALDPAATDGRHARPGRTARSRWRPRRELGSPRRLRRGRTDRLVGRCPVPPGRDRIRPRPPADLSPFSASIFPTARKPGTLTARIRLVEGTGAVGERWLVLTAVSLPSGVTALRADVQVLWLRPRDTIRARVRLVRVTIEARGRRQQPQLPGARTAARGGHGSPAELAGPGATLATADEMPGVARRGRPRLPLASASAHTGRAGDRCRGLRARNAVDPRQTPTAGTAFNRPPASRPRSNTRSAAGTCSRVQGRPPLCGEPARRTPKRRGPPGPGGPLL